MLSPQILMCFFFSFSLAGLLFWSYHLKIIGISSTIVVYLSICKHNNHAVQKLKITNEGCSRLIPTEP